jgi:hypothetical protein
MVGMAGSLDCLFGKTYDHRLGHIRQLLVPLRQIEAIVIFGRAKMDGSE